jgi:predicted nucleic acid-binding protein
MVLDEVLFKMQMAEAAKVFALDIRSIARFLKSNPDKIPTLSQSWKNIEKIKGMAGLGVVEVTAADFWRSISLAQTHHLLPHDALHLAVMQRRRVKTIATHDPDFDTIPGLVVFKPVAEHLLKRGSGGPEST